MKVFRWAELPGLRKSSRVLNSRKVPSENISYGHVKTEVRSKWGDTEKDPSSY